MSNTKDKIIHQLGETIRLLGGQSDILGTVFSQGDTQPDEQVLELVQRFNEAVLRERQNKELIVIPATAKEFHAGEIYFRVEDTLSVSRYKEFERLSIELGFGLGFGTLFGKIRTGYDLMNTGKLADAAVNQYNILEGLTLLDEKKPIALYVATLFINTADEDRTKWTIASAEQKLKVWNDARLDVTFFLIVALSRVEGFSEAYKNVSPLSSMLKPDPESG